jgi:ribonucleotide monophosphatase NagD (HAD superfamily)
MDLLLSKNGVIGTRSTKNGNPELNNNGYLQDGQPTLHFCNPDLEWSTQFSQPRLAQGGFKASLLGIWQDKTGGADLRYSVCGKPTTLTYTFGEETLNRWANRDTVSSADKTTLTDTTEIGTFCMIGDNPESDIQGANNFVSKHGYDWKSVLVESGVYVKGTIPSHTPTHIASNIKEAVAWALRDFTGK